MNNHISDDDRPVYMGESDPTLPCKLCGEDSTACYEYTLIHRQAQVCSKCASIVANTFSMKHSGEYLTWPNEVRESEERQRKTISTKVRKLIFERDAYRCVKCSSHINLCLDHIFPHSLGGSDEPENLQTLCWVCNNRKRDKIEVAA